MKNLFKKETVKGYKAFDKGLLCRGFQFELGKDFIHEGKPVLCSSGFHFCKNLSDVYGYYAFDTENTVVCEIEAFGDVVDEEGGNKSVTNGIRLLRILNAEQASNNNGNKNVGHSNTGNSNTGDWNTGDRNTGHSNTGNWNTGNSNTGHSNTGNSNTGHWNTGDRNTGNSNTGNRNTGHWNTGDRNTGNSNTGNRNTGNSNTGNSNTGNSNTGDWNTGDWNTGHSNTGDRNTGNRNTGDRNTGDRNTGYRNTGHSNTGDWNTGDRNTGYMNTVSPMEVLIFNKFFSYEEFMKIDKPYCLYFDTKKWIDFSDMTDEEKIKFPACKTAGGYVKYIPYKEAFTASMEKASKADIEKIKKFPNFDKNIFFEISGFMID